MLKTILKTQPFLVILETGDDDLLTEWTESQLKKIEDKELIEKQMLAIKKLDSLRFSEFASRELIEHSEKELKELNKQVDLELTKLAKKNTEFSRELLISKGYKLTESKYFENETIEYWEK